MAAQHDDADDDDINVLFVFRFFSAVFLKNLFFLLNIKLFI